MYAHTKKEEEEEDMISLWFLISHFSLINKKSKKESFKVSTTKSALIEFSHSTSVAKTDARGSTDIWEYLITENEPVKKSQPTQEKLW